MQNKRGREVHTDALWLAKRTLEGLRAQKIYIENLEQDIEDKYETATNMIVTYGEHIGHNTEDKLNPGARFAESESFQTKKRELIRAKRILARIERAVEQLARAEQMIITQRYIIAKPMPWHELALEVGYEIRNCHKLHSKALRAIAIHLCGLEKVLGK
ncbi:MAG: hypothetical protein ACYDEJ_03310 [Desulfitobacteriaceae bacterium]